MARARLESPALCDIAPPPQSNNNISDSKHNFYDDTGNQDLKTTVSSITAGSDSKTNNKPTSFDINRFFQQLLHRPPEPSRDEKFAANVLPVSNSTGGKPYREDRDGKSHQAYHLPWPAPRVPYGEDHHTVVDSKSDSNHGMEAVQASQHALPSGVVTVPRFGYRAAPQFDSDWEPILAYHHGLYAPESFEPAKQLSEIRAEVADFEKRLRHDSPENDACRYLAAMEFKCLRQNHFKIDPQLAARRCVKWYNELRQCEWDQEKVRQGIHYIEPCVERKHRPFYSAPQFRS